MVVSPIDNLLHFLYALGREECAPAGGNNIPREEEEEYVDHHTESHAAAAPHKTATVAAAEITMTRRFSISAL